MQKIGWQCLDVKKEKGPQMSSLITSLGGNDEIGVWKLCWTRNLGITWNYFFFMKKIDCRRMIFIYDLVNLKDWFIQSYLHKSSFIWSDLNFWPQGFEDVTNFAIFSLHCRFITRRGFKICADPAADWVNKAVQSIDRKNLSQIKPTGAQPSTNTTVTLTG